MGEPRVGGGLIDEVGRQATLLAELAERVGAAGGFQQVGGDLGVVDEVARYLPSDFASWAITGCPSVASTSSSGRWRGSGDHRLRLVDVGAEPPLLVIAEQRPLRRVWRA